MRIALLFLLVLASVTVQSGPPSIADGAPPELMHWGQLVGEWSTVEESLKPDGSAWVPSTGADWNFDLAYDPINETRELHGGIQR